MKLLEHASVSSWVNGFRHVTCSRPDCSRWLTQRHLNSRKVGVTFEDEWYCSYRCLASELDATLAKLVRPVRSSSKHSFRMPLGLTLVSRGQLTEDQFRHANEKQKEEGREISDVLLDMGYVTEKQVTAVRAAQWACPVFEIPEFLPPLAFPMPLSMMMQYRMVPLRYQESIGKISIGFVAGIEYGPLYALERMTGCKAQPFLITQSDFSRFIASVPVPEPARERVFDTRQSPLEIRHLICTLGAQMDAEEVSMVRCANQLWARLRQDKQVAELLFQVT